MKNNSGWFLLQIHDSIVHFIYLKQIHYFIVYSSILNVVLMQRNCTQLYDVYTHKQEELSRARTFLRREMGLDLGSGASNVPINFTKDDINMYVKRFKNLDGDNKGYITVNDLRRYFKVGPFWFCVDVVEDQMLINNNITVSIWWVSKSRSILSLFFLLIPSV